MNVLTPTQDRRLTELYSDRKLYSGLDGFTHRAVGAVRRRPGAVRRFLSEAERIDDLASAWRTRSDRALRERLEECRAAARRRRRTDREALRIALAVMREVADRRLGLYPHPVQLAAAVALHEGYLVELATGEGKTLSAALAAVMAGWTGFPLHVVTANDYLARRDAEWMRPLYRFCGLQAGHIEGEQAVPERREAYAADITYTTSKELVADFLRDRLRLGELQEFTSRRILSLARPGLIGQRAPLLRGVHTAIVDEADHLLIDEAVTPVILSSPHPNEAFRQACIDARAVSERLTEGLHFTVDMGYMSVELTDRGYESVRAACDGMPGLWRAARRSAELVTQALTARCLYENGKQYVVQDGKVVIVDEFTGRLMPQRTWREGLHQAVEAREGLELSDLSETSMRLSFQRFFRFFTRLSGMTGTAREAAPEFWQIYGLPVVCIPTHRPIQRLHLTPRLFSCAAEKWRGVVAEIQRVHALGRPILVGVRSVKKSEHLSILLTEVGLEHQVLNATLHREEAQIISRAGGKGLITIATNMAGRGTDIALGHGVAELGGLHVLATEFHEAGRVDRQLYGRSGRQGDPGSAVTFAAMDDELTVRYVAGPVRRQTARALTQGAGWSPHAAVRLSRYAQKVAEARAFRQRRSVLKTDDWVDESLSFAGGTTL